MKDKWSHINAFIKESNERKKQVKQSRQEAFEPVTLDAQVVKPVKTFDLQIDSFIGYIANTLIRPYAILKDNDSSRFFFYASLNFAIYLLIIFFIGCLSTGGFNWIEGIRQFVAGASFTMAMIVFTFFIQILSINRMNTIYKVYVDVISYLTLVSFIGMLQVVLLIIDNKYHHMLELISFLVIMSIPMRLFGTYNDRHKFDIDIFKLNVIFIVLMVIYMILTREIVWLSYYENI